MSEAGRNTSIRAKDLKVIAARQDVNQISPTHFPLFSSLNLKKKKRERWCQGFSLAFNPNRHSLHYFFGFSTLIHLIENKVEVGLFVWFFFFVLFLFFISGRCLSDPVWGFSHLSFRLGRFPSLPLNSFSLSRRLSASKSVFTLNCHLSARDVRSLTCETRRSLKHLGFELRSCWHAGVNGRTGRS